MFPACRRDGSAAPLLAGRYRLLAEAGRGGSALVFRAVDITRGADVALKRLRPEFTDDAARRAELGAEAAALAGLDHPAIVRLHGAGEAACVPFLALDWLAGPDLRATLRAGETLSPVDAARLLGGIGAALHSLHRQGLVHGDVKPGNLMRATDGRLVLIDFGNACRIGSQPAGGARVLTPAYAAPDRLRAAPADPRDDVYALAVIAYELIAGRHPFARRPAQPGEVPAPVAGLAAGSWRWLRAALSHARAERPADPRGISALRRPASWFFSLPRRGAACPA